jgi:hypothetical protein
VLAGAGDGDVGEASLFFELVRVVAELDALVGEHPVFERGENTVETPAPWPSARS